MEKPTGLIWETHTEKGKGKNCMQLVSGQKGNAVTSAKHTFSCILTSEKLSRRNTQIPNPVAILVLKWMQ